MRLFSRLNVGGPAIHVVLLASGLRARGYETRLVVGKESPREGNMLDFARARGVDCVRLAGLGREVRPLADLRTLLALRRLMREFEPRIVHTHTAKAGLLGRLAARLARVPLVVHTYHGHVLQGYFDPLRSALYRGLERGLARTSDALVAVSPSVKRELLEMGIGPPHKIRVVPLGLELEALAAELPRGGLRRDSGVAAGAPLVGMVGRLVPIKDVPTFLAAAARIAARRPDVRFALVGDGEQRALLESEAGRLGLGASVFFHGWRRDREAVFGDLDVVVNSSRNEGTPVALIEALAAARPVVATAVGGTPDLLADGAYGRLVPARDPRALADAVLEALEQPEAATARARAGRAAVLARHSLARLLDDMDALYRELCARGARAA